MAAILIVEDEEKIARFVELELQHEGYETGKATDGLSGLSLAESGKYDLMVLDIMLPGINGLEVLRRLRKTSDMPVILLTARDAVMDKVSGLEMGADDYMTKPFGIMELLSRVKALLRRSAGAQTKRLEVGNLVLDDERHLVMVKGENCELTFKEYELLKLLMANCGMVLTREVIMERVWGTDFEGESRTLDMHIKTLRQKLGEEGSMIRTVRNVGYLLEKD